MECTFQVGDKVVCVEQLARGAELMPQVGLVYTVRSIVSVSPGIGLQFVEIKNSARSYMDGIKECAFTYMAFRPVKTTKTDISIFTEIVRREFDVDKVAKPVKEIA